MMIMMIIIMITENSDDHCNNNNNNYTTNNNNKIITIMPFSRRPTAACFDLDLGPMTLVLELDLDTVLLYHCAKKKVSVPSASKVTS